MCLSKRDACSTGRCSAEIEGHDVGRFALAEALPLRLDMVGIHNRDRARVHMIVLRGPHVGRVHEVKNQLSRIGAAAAFHARLIPGRAIMSEQQVVPVLVVDGDHLMVRSGKQHLHDRAAGRGDVKGGHDLIGRLAVLAHSDPRARQLFERVQRRSGLLGRRILLAGQQFSRCAIPHHRAMRQTMVTVAIGAGQFLRFTKPRHAFA